MKKNHDSRYADVFGGRHLSKGTRREWERLLAKVTKTERRAAAARVALTTFLTSHRSDNPLTAGQRGALREAVAGGRPLCCESGRAVLAELVDPIWADWLNALAYEEMQCRGSDVDDNLDKLEKLLDS